MFQKNPPSFIDAGLTGVIRWIPQLIEYLQRCAFGVNADLDAKMPGRLRRDRSAPSSETDVVAGDIEGDTVRTASAEYVLIDDGGTLKWREITWAAP